MADRDTVLLIDDDRELAATVSEFLEQRGYPVVVAHSGQAGLALLRRIPVDLVLLDLRLPDVDGVTLMKEAHALDVAPEVIVITGHATLETAIAAVEAGAAAYIRKPFDFHRVGALVERVVQRRQLARENARLSRELADRLRETEALVAISTTISSTLDLREALRRLSRELTRLLGADAAGAYLHEVGSDVLVPYAGYHVPREHREALATVSLPLREHEVYLPIWKDRRAIYSDDIPHDPRFGHELFRRVPHQSGLLLPLILEDEVVAAFYLVWSTARRRFTDRELALLQNIGGQVALLLGHARLYDTGARDRHRLMALNELARYLGAVHETEQILSLIVSEATRLLATEAAGIRLLDGDDLVLSARTAAAAPVMARPRIKVGESLTGRVVATGEPVAVENLLEDSRFDPVHQRGAREAGFHGFLGVPLRVQGRIIGALNVYSGQTRRFSRDEIALLAALADQASLAIDKGRLYAETRAREREVTKLYEVTSQLVSTLELDRILDLITAKTVDLLACDASAVFIHDKTRGELRFLRGLHLDPELTGDVFAQPGEGTVGRAFHERRPAWNRDRADRPLAEAEAPTDAGTPRAELAAPIVSRGEAHGVLIAYFFVPHDFTPKEVQLLSTLAAHAAMALDSSRLYAEAQAQRTRLALIFDSTSDGIVLLGRDGRIEAANRRAGELLGFDPAAVVGLGPMALLADLCGTPADHDRALTACRAFLEAPDHGGRGDIEVVAPVRRVLHWVGQPTKDAAGSTIGVTLTFHDVTEERAVSQMKSDFVAFVTHQLRTPLSGIRWLLELAAEGAAVPEETRSYIRDTRESAERLVRLVNDLLNVSRLESGKLTVASQPVHLGDITRSVVEQVGALIRERGHRLSIAGAETVPPVAADPQLLREAVLNLVSNAVKYTLPGGDIAIRMSREDRSVRWAIRDSGIGIPKEAQHRLFEKFFRAENVLTVETEGTGLGLYLVRLILEQFGGRVWCESAEGEGATFLFTLPL